MATVEELPGPTWSVERLRRHFGGIPAERLRLKPRPGSATEKDLIHENEVVRRGTCELIDGCLVEKAMGAREALLAGAIIHYLHVYLAKNPCGVVLAPDGTLRLMPGLVRAPDVSYISWDRIGADEFPEDPIPDLAPELAIEVLSRWNTRKEIARKLKQYFASGVLEAWVIDPRKRIAEIYHSPSSKRTIGVTGILDCPAILPGFQLPLGDLFAAQKRRRGR